MLHFVSTTPSVKRSRDLCDTSPDSNSSIDSGNSPLHEKQVLHKPGETDLLQSMSTMYDTDESDFELDFDELKFDKNDPPYVDKLATLLKGVYKKLDHLCRGQQIFESKVNTAFDTATKAIKIVNEQSRQIQKLKNEIVYLKNESER